MSNARDQYLGKLATGVRGVSYRPEHLQESFNNDSVVLLRSNNINDGSLNYNSLQFVPEHIVQNIQYVAPGDIVVCMSNGSKQLVGKSASCLESAPEKLTVGAFCSVFHPNGDADASFVGHIFRSPRFRHQVDFALAGSAINNLRNSEIEKFTFRIPPISEQSRIASVLDTVDALIESSEAVLAKLRQVRAGLLHDLLTRGLDADGQLRDPDAHPEQFKDSPLGRIPREWEIDSLVSRISFPQGQVDPRYEPYCDFTLVAPDHIESETGRLLERATAAAQGAISGKYLFAAGDVLYSKIRPYLRKAVLADETGLCSADMYPLRPQPGTNPKFLLAVMLGESFSRFASAVSMRSGFPKINRQEMAEYQLAWPLPDEQNRIADVIESHDDLITAEQSELTKLRHLKSGLMTDLLEGRVRVPEDLAREAARTRAANGLDLPPR